MSAQTYRHRLLLQLLARKRSSSQGFTLIELLVVIVILGVLGAVGYQAYIDQVARANQGTASVAALAAAKSCAALRVTGQTAEWTDGVVNSNQVTVGGACPAATTAQTFTATAGTGTNARTAQAVLNANGSVTD